MLQKFLDQLAEKIAEKVADKLTALISAQLTAAEQNVINKVEVYEKQIEQLPQQIINDLNPFKAH